MARRPGVIALVCLLLPGFAWAQSASELHEMAVAQRQERLQQLDTDPSLADLGELERLRARQAVEAAAVAKRRDREHRLAVADLRIEAASLAAQAELLAGQSGQLDRERDQIMIESSRLEAAKAQRESERLRLRALAREEAAERDMAASTMALEAAGAETAQARKLAQARAREAELARKEAELASAVAAEDITDAAPPPMRRVDGRRVYTLAGSAFGSGSATLTAAAQASLRALAAELGGASVRIEGHTDSQGADSANLALSQQRAQAVRRVLEDAGVPGSRLTAKGLGETQPVADNATADGRAANRRVEISVD
jgi:outer membrane protein OmpA-like peptidoglycan-associated protein